MVSAMLCCSLNKPACAQQAQSLQEQLRSVSAESLAELARAEGDASRGALLFHQAQLQCSACHSDRGAGRLGPNLATPASPRQATDLVESILWPNRKVADAFRVVVLSTVDGRTETGLLVAKDNEQITLRDVQPDGTVRRWMMTDVESFELQAKSIMPEGLVNLLADRKQFLDLLRYVMEISEGGEARARELEPPAALTQLPPLPAYESSIDHAGIIRSWDDASLERGEQIYARVCANCHGTHDRLTVRCQRPRGSDEASSKMAAIPIECTKR